MLRVIPALLTAMCLHGGPIFAADLSAVAARAQEVMLLPVYHSYQLRPCQYYGFSFDDNYSELKQMRELGALAVGTNRIWMPIEDADAPNGDGYRLEEANPAGVPLEQSFIAGRPFDSVAVTAPTFITSDSGLTLTLYRVDNDGGRQEIVKRAFSPVEDNAWLSLDVSGGVPGKYAIQASGPTGSRIGLWAMPHDVYRDGEASVGGKTRDDFDFLLRLKYEGESDYTELVPADEGKVPVPLSPSLWDALDELGMYCSVAAGDWNNGLFPYYPDWFYEKYADFAMVDQNGKRVEATMFDKPKAWPPIDHPQQIAGASRFTAAQVSSLKDRNVSMWVMGGEELYPTYCFPGRWADYQTNSLSHFREWCRLKYGDIAKLNEGWGTDCAGFEEVNPAKTPALDVRWADWIDYRFRAMAERFVWLYQAIMEADTSRLAITANHGNIYDGLAAARMGMLPEVYASVSDGFETGQIMEGGDAWYYNLMYTDTLCPLGKPVSPNRLAYKFPDPKARGGARSYTPQTARRYAYESLGTGAWFLGLIQWRGSLPDGEWGVKSTRAVEEIGKVFKELRELTPYLQHVYPVKPRLGVYVSRYAWSLEGFDKAWRELHSGLIERQVPRSFLYDESDWTGYPMLLSVNNRIVSSAGARKLRSYVKSGGTLVIVGGFAEVDETLKPHAGPVLAKSVQVTRVPGLNAWTSKIGRGMVIWLMDDPKTEFADRVCRLLDDLGFSSPTRVESDEFVTRETEVPVGATDRFPFDLSGIRTVGQTLTAPGAVTAIRFSTPTFCSEVEGFSLRVAVRKNRPGGEILSEIEIPAEELTDNSWHEVPVSARTSAGTRLYLEIESPTGLPKSRLGVWTGRDDWYPDGAFHVDGSRAQGDVDFRVKIEETLPLTRVVEAFTLTDGLNYIQVFVNTASEPVSFQASLTQGLADPESDYHVRDVVSGRYFGRRAGDAISYDLELPANGTAAVLVMYDASKDEAAKAVKAAESASRHWHGFGRQYAPVYSDSAREALKAGKYAKAVALAAKAVSAIGISASAKSGDGGLQITASLVDSGGKPVTDAEVRAAVNPAFGLTVKLSHIGGGRYSARLSKDDVPMMYDYEARKYVPLSGPVTVDVTARRGSKVGAARVAGKL